MKKISSFIRNMKEQAKKQKGFKTNTNAIRDYLFQFITYLKSKIAAIKTNQINWLRSISIWINHSDPLPSISSSTCI